MSTKIILRDTDGSIGATLPRALAERFHLEAGDAVFAIETDSGTF